MTPASEPSRQTDDPRAGRKPRRSRVSRSLLVAACGGVVLVAAAVFTGWWTARPLPDFAAYEVVDERKEAFFSYLAPLVQRENERVRAQRTRLLAIERDLLADGRIGWADRRWLRALAAEYEVEYDRDAPGEAVAMLEPRVDTVPVALALVQAAAESAWGRSRFAREGNNLFGQWCYVEGCGIVPNRRGEGRIHEVAAFESPAESVARYINNLNTHPAYAPLRAIRASLREAGQRPRALALADGLIRYSERREDYVEEVKAVIRANRPLIDRVLEEQG
ncbi:MAG: glucosaminidase domain-containing protein [Wenzhouxiangellaceae bacterium]|nr:glucosaminidase domain-containing protein [Wenzhouxiangellaceae bacterium]